MEHGSRATALTTLVSLLPVLCLLPERAAVAEEAPPAENWVAFDSKILEKRIFVGPNVFWPLEAEQFVLPYMTDHPELFKDKTVLEIGVGSGINTLYALMLGAKKVVATDISKEAIAAARKNTSEYGDRADIRFVPPNDTSAYAVIRADERFDIILSNPPFSLNLDASGNDAMTDDGSLGPSLLQGLSTHLTDSGVAVLLYRSLFYQQFMVKYARHLGYQVRYDAGDKITHLELEALSNLYLRRISEHLDLRVDAIQIDGAKDWKDVKINVERAIDSEKREKSYPGIIVVTPRS